MPTALVVLHATLTKIVRPSKKQQPNHSKGDSAV